MEMLSFQNLVKPLKSLQFTVQQDENAKNRAKIRDSWESCNPTANRLSGRFFYWPPESHAQTPSEGTDLLDGGAARRLDIMPAFRTVAEALISDYPERFKELVLAYPRVKMPLKFNRRMEIVADRSEQESPMAGELRRAM